MENVALTPKDYAPFRLANLVHTDEAALAESTPSAYRSGANEPGSRSSAGERLLHTQDVASSILAATTTPDDIDRMLSQPVWRADVEARFWPKVEVGGQEECWLWSGARKKSTPGQDYGNFKLRSYVTVRSHRLAYALSNGRSPRDAVVCHRCDTPRCCNPAHLFLGTVADNNRDKLEKGRNYTGDQRGENNGAAKLTGADVSVIRRRIGSGHTNMRIAGDYGVTHQAISRIRRGRSWALPLQRPGSPPQV